MSKSQQNDNFIDKTFTVVADILLKVLPVTKEEKQAFSYYRYGMAAQSEGEYAEALENYYEALRLEEDPFDRSYILYNIGLIYGSSGEYVKALEYYHQSLDLNLRLPQALNNIAVIYHYQGVRSAEKKDFENSKIMFDKAGEYWKRAIQLAPNNYIQAQNWLKNTGRMPQEDFS
jgi:tetratricopeptide (TPR) repeat protein|tara:strand:- start:936 stop:1457 length:522 start_codon:yes stop_codon:yes gene_type:complete